ncbi:MAG: hypothetical protein ACOCV8_01125 [Spirochaetota bacterium]
MGRLNNIKVFITRYKFIIILCIIYLIVGSILLPFYIHQINPDGISYIVITQKYLQGNFSEAVNGHWAPLYSWLSIPLFAMNINPLTAMKVLGLIIGLFTLLGFYKLSLKFTMDNFTRKFVNALSGFVILSYAYAFISPDLLLVCFLLLYLNLIFNEDYTNKKHYGIITGIVGAFSYFAKHYALPFFIAHFLIFNVIKFIQYTDKEERRTILINTITGFMIFIIIASLWIIPISLKYDKFTFFNDGVADPCGERMAIDNAGLLPLKEHNVYNMWEDPEYIKETETYKQKAENCHLLENPLIEKKDNIIIRMFYGIIYLLKNYNMMNYIALPLLIFTLIYIISKFKEIDRNIIFYTFITVAIYSGGFVVIGGSNIRYLWFCNLLILLLPAYFLTKLFNSDFFKEKSDRKRKIIKVIIYILIILFFSVRPFKVFNIRERNDKILFPGDEEYNLSRRLEEYNKEYNIENSIVASNINWHDTFALAYHLDFKYLGVLEKYITPEMLEKDINKYNIDYFFYWTDLNIFKEKYPAHLKNIRNIKSYLDKNYIEITNNKITELEIYKLDEHK